MNFNTLWMKKPVFNEPGEPAPGAAPDAPPASDAASADAPPADPTPAADFSFVPEQFRKDDGVDTEGFQSWLGELQATKTKFDERMAGVPEDPSAYEFAIPDDLDYGQDIDLPDNFALNIKADDADMKPLFSELGSFLHQHGIPKEGASQVMGLLAKYEAAQYSRQMVAQEGEMRALGDGAQRRITDVQRALEGKLPADMAQALMSATKSAAGVRALERLLGPNAFSGGLPQPKETPQVSSAAARYPTSVAS